MSSEDVNNERKFGDPEVPSFGYKKKNKKKSFLQKAKKFGKQGRFGKGRQIDKDTYNYFVRVLENWNQEKDGLFEDDKESKETFIENVFEQTRGEEVALASNQLVSRVIEQILPSAPFGVLRRFMEALAEDLRIVAMDPFASHVLEKCLFLASFTKESSKKSSEELEFSEAWIIRVSKFAINNFEFFVEDTYACHILKSCFQCLGGVLIPIQLLRSKRSREQGVKFANEENDLKPLHDEESFKPVLSGAVDRLIDCEHLKDKLSSDVSGGVVQVLLLVLEKTLPKLCKKLCKHLIETAFDEDEDKNDCEEEVASVFLCEPKCRTLETMIAVSSSFPKIYSKLYKHFFKDNLCKLAKHPCANFAVQKLLLNCQDKEQFESWYENEFDANLEDIIASGNTGVILAIAQTCRRLSAKQAHFVVALMKSFHCYEPQSLQIKVVPLLSKFVTKESAEAAETEFPIHLQGSLIIQELLSFNKPIKIVNSLLGMDPGSLRSLLSDPRGSHITDSFMTSKTIGEKSRDGLVKSLKGELVTMACNKHGSRSIDAIWKNSSTKGRELLASELVTKEALLNSNQFGKFISQNMSLSLFKRNREEWRTGLKREDKKRKIFSDIIDLSSSEKKAKVEEPEEGENFVIDTKGENIEKIKKAKKVVAQKSYLDDL